MKPDFLEHIKFGAICIINLVQFALHFVNFRSELKSYIWNGIFWKSLPFLKQDQDLLDLGYHFVTCLFATYQIYPFAGVLYGLCGKIDNRNLKFLR